MFIYDSSSDAELIEVGVPPRAADYVRRIWQRRDFIWSVPLAQLKAQTESTVLGVAWHLLNPLLTAALYYIVFGVLFGGRGLVEDYPAFLVVGIFTFLYTNRTIQAGASAMITNMGLITQINFPRLSLPLAATVAEAVSHSFALLTLFAMVPFLGGQISISWFAVIPAVLVQTIFNFGLASIVARATFKYRDVRNLLPHVLRAWLYLSGLFFSVELVEEAAGADSILVDLFELNPGYIFMSLMRSALIDGSWSTASIWLTALGWAIGVAFCGFYFFRSHEVEYGHG